MKPEVKSNLIRGLYIAAFFVIFYFIWYFFVAIAVFQLIHNLAFSYSNAQILRISETANQYFLDVLRFITFTSDVIPFPFTSWPSNKMK
jgi:hypothetical protein